MAIPDTTTFSLSDVVTEIIPTTNDLVDCFADAVAGKFDATYSGDQNQLLNFRNYGAVTTTAFSSSINERSVCSATIDQTYYHSGTGSLPVVGDTVWTDQGTTPLGLGNRRKSGTTTYNITSSTTGLVDSVGTCD